MAASVASLVWSAPLVLVCVFPVFCPPFLGCKKKDSSLEHAVQIILALTFVLITTLFAVAASYCLPRPPKVATSAMAKRHKQSEKYDLQRRDGVAFPGR